MLRRCVTLAVSCCLVLALALAPVDLLFAQGDVKKVAAQPPAKAEAATKETPKPDATKSGEPAKKPETAKDDAAKKDAGKTRSPPRWPSRRCRRFRPRSRPRSTRPEKPWPR